MELRENFESKFIMEELPEAASKSIAARLRYPFIIGDKMNGNGRIYPSRILKREISRMMERIAESGVAGQLNHPVSGSTELDRVSHIITDLSWIESERKGVALSSILRTSKGQDLIVMLKSGLKLGASVRGYGNVAASGEVQDDYKLESIDIVLGPSFGKDVEISSQNLIESGNQYLSKNPYQDEMRMRMRYQFARKAGFRGSFADYGSMKKEK